MALSLIDALDAAEKDKNTRTCGVADFLAALPADQLDRVRAWLVAGHSKYVLHRVLVESAGFRLSPSSLNNHLAGRCSCAIEGTNP